MKAYAWPGNVRELENVVRRLMALYPQDVISREIVEQELRADISDSPIAKVGVASGSMTIAQAVEENMRTYFASFGDGLPPPGLYERVLAEMEYPLILAALTATRGNQIKAADLLGLNRNTLRKKIRELGFPCIVAPVLLDTPGIALQFRHNALLKSHETLSCSVAGLSPSGCVSECLRQCKRFGAASTGAQRLGQIDGRASGRFRE